MTAAIKRTHAGVIFDPNTNILEFDIDAPACAEQLADVSPVGENKMKRTVGAVAG